MWCICCRTSPVYVRPQGGKEPVDRLAHRALAGHLESMLAWVAREGRFENEVQRERLRAVFLAARDRLAERNQ
jgi:hypothetical protein